jgi:ABC-2 type transport system ATP-binding protein
MHEPPVIQTERLTRYFGKRAAVYELNLKVPRGSVFAFLGRNGSGKTTTIRMLLGLLEPTRGSGSILGYDIGNLPPEARARIGYLTEDHQLYGWMTVRECGDFQSRFYPRWNEKVFLGITDHFGLKDDARVKDLSRGERAGLCLAVTLAPEPELLILDDPAVGLDPVARRSLVESMIYLTRRADRTVFFSSHQLADVERVADYIAVLDRSVLRACCPLEMFQRNIQQVRARFGAGTAGSPAITAATSSLPLAKIPGLLQVSRNGNELRLVCVGDNGRAERELKALGAEEVEHVPISLEDAFISYLGERGEKSFILPETEVES